MEKYPQQVGFISAGDGFSGLICIEAEENTSDWNIVRAFGDGEKCTEILHTVPFADYVLIQEKPKNQPREKSLLFFESLQTYGEDENEDFELSKFANTEFGLHINALKTRVSQVDSRLDDIYICQGKEILGYIKVTRCSWHYAEIAITVSPQFRNQGWGTVLLSLMIEQARRKKVKLSYVAESDNLPSISLANKCGLSYLQSLAFSSVTIGKSK